VIISRTPFRISFAGGGSDMRGFYSREPGCVLSTSIDRYMYIAVHPFFFPGQTLVKYSRTELVHDVAMIQHPIVREVLMQFAVSGVDINSIADIPSGTGLGTSSAFTVGLLNAVHAYLGKFATREELARLACDIEIERLKSPIGKQDQYGSAIGGLNFIRFEPDESVTVERIALSGVRLSELQDNLLTFYTEGQRSANDILAVQADNVTAGGGAFDAQRRIVRLAEELREELQKGNIDALGQVLHESWLRKKELAAGVSNARIDDIYDRAIRAGASGGKLLGAGGSGFMLFYVKPDRQAEVRSSLAELRELSLRFDFSGSTIISTA
jgi:D-glycero-alpha-D-manno-heptose-7-phosphate kinase